MPSSVRIITRANATRRVTVIGDDMPTKAPEIFEVAVDSTASKVTAVLVDEDNNALDVQSATSVLFHCKKKVAGVWENVSRDQAAGFVSNGSDGEVEYGLTSTELASEADLYAEFECVEYDGAEPLISDTLIVRVKDRNRVPA